MRIAQLAPLAESVPPVGYGGTELVISLLTEELVRRGHEVTLFASGDSRTAASLEAGVPSSLRLRPDVPPTRWAGYEIAQVLEVERRAGEFDIIHNHMGWLALPFLRHFTVPSLSTNHNPVKPYNRLIYTRCRDLPYVAISNAYRRLNHPDVLNYVGTVYNGIEVDGFIFNPEVKDGYLLFLGRIGQDKGADLACEFAREVGMPLKLAGKVDTADQEFFVQKVKPFLADKQIDYIGEVGFQDKIELYANAFAVIYPITFDEPFGLVMVESLASGTPVIALDRGSVSEVLSDGETAVIDTSLQRLAERFGEVAALSRHACRRRVEERFTHTRMVESYLDLYEKVLSGTARAATPRI